MGILSNLDSIDSLISSLIYVLPAVIIALSFHEFGHAYVANLNGDSTAKMMGRMTLNPLKHIDLFGFVCMLLVGFGWAKPVPVNPNNYRNYKKGEITVSLAGVIMNLLLALVGTIILSAVFAIYINAGTLNTVSAERLITLLATFISINCCLLFFNLIPIYPLDGFHVAEVLLSKYIGSRIFMFIKQYGQYILFALIIIGSRTGLSLVSIAAGWLTEGLYKIAFNIALLLV